jgi:DNA-binding NarL/FixJ family response regulator
MPIKVLLADDSDVIRRAIRRLLQEQSEIEVVGEATGLAQAIRMTNDLKPQVIIMDVHMRDEYTLKPMKVRSCLDGCSSRIVAISLWNDEETRELTKSIGAVALLDKAELHASLIPAIKNALRPA